MTTCSLTHNGIFTYTLGETHRFVVVPLKSLLFAFPCPDLIMLILSTDKVKLQKLDYMPISPDT